MVHSIVWTHYRNDEHRALGWKGGRAARNKSKFDKKWAIRGARFSRYVESKGGKEILIHAKTKNEIKKADETITDFLK